MHGNVTFSNEDLEALYNGTANIKTKLLVKDIYNANIEYTLSEKDSIKTWDLIDERYVPDNGFIGQFVAKTLEGELHNISDDFNIENREAILLMGITTFGQQESDTTWYQLGTYIILSPEDNEVSDNTKFEAIDYTTKFNIDFDANFTNDTWTTSFAATISNEESFTAIQLAQYTCAQVGITFANNEFTNYDFQISTNQFTEGNSCRDVMKAISQLAFGWVRIGWDDQCYIDELEMDTENISEYNVIDNNHYYSLTTQKNNYGPINQVTVDVIAIDGTHATIIDPESIDTNGVNELVVYDNPITYTYELRELAVPGGERLFGLQYAPFEMETPGHPWLMGHNLIKIVDMEGNERLSYPFNRTIKYTGHIKMDIITPNTTDAETNNSFNRTLYKTVRNLSITVNKQDGVITTINSRVDATEEGLGKVETRFEEEITDTYSKQEIQKIITGVAEDGTVVSSVTSASGTFDMDGLTIEQSSKPNTKTNVNGDGLVIYNTTGVSSDDKLLEVNSEGVISKNNTIERYLTIGKHSRIEDYRDIDGTEGTGVFWLGG